MFHELTDLGLVLVMWDTLQIISPNPHADSHTALKNSHHDQQPNWERMIEINLNTRSLISLAALGFELKQCSCKMPASSLKQLGLKIVLQCY